MNCLPPTTINYICPYTHTHNNNITMNARKYKKSSGMASGGLRSLSFAVAFPLSLTLLEILLFSGQRRLHKPFYFPPLWALHSAFLVHAFITGLSAWLIWAEGGFHRQPKALVACVCQMLLSLGWYPLVLGAGAIRVGLALCGAILGVMVGCTRMFTDMNPIAGDLVKFCFVWSVLLAILNVRFVYYYVYY